MVGDLRCLFLKSGADETFSGDPFQFFLVDDLWRLLSPSDHVHVKVDIADSVWVELDWGVDIGILSSKGPSF